MKNINFTGTEGNIEIWANLSTENADLTEFDNRSQIVKNIVSIARKNEIKGINVYAYDIDQNLERFIIELSPKLRELGIKTNIIVNKNFNEENKKIYEDIIDYTRMFIGLQNLKRKHKNNNSMCNNTNFRNI